MVSTPYWHAAELLAEDRGVLVPFASPGRGAEGIGLLRDDTRRHAMRKTAYRIGREMVWSNVAQLYMRSFELSRLEGAALPENPGRENPGPAASRTARAEAQSPGADDRFDRRLPARDFQYPQFFRRLLYRR